MKSTRTRQSGEMVRPFPTLTKAATGIAGLDELTGGGLPAGRSTLLCGNAGCGKTLLSMEFLVRGAIEYGEPGVFMAFEETTRELAANVASFGHDLPRLVAKKQLVLDHVFIERVESEESGEYDLDGLLIRLGSSIDSIGAKRVVLDTIESLFSSLPNATILRAELRRLFRWLKDRGVTAIITGERGETGLTRFGLEEYVADCVILLDHRVDGQMTTRRLRVVKYRGSTHGTSEYPFLIDEGGISILPTTSMQLNHPASTERVSSGVGRLDAMMGGKGYYRGSSVLVSGTAGSGKSSLSAHFAHAAGERGERCLWFSFEESQNQILRNMRSIGLDLAPAVRRGHLRFHTERPLVCGLEMHLITIHKQIYEFKPSVVIIDPINSFAALGAETEVKAMLVRLIDFLKSRQITAFCTSLTGGSNLLETTDAGMSSLMDSWLMLQDVENGAERNRVLHLLKSRGMAHSNQVREFLLTTHGVELKDVYVGPSGGLLTGTARITQEAQETAQALERAEEIGTKSREVERKRQAMEARVEVLRAEFEIEHADLTRSVEEQKARAGVLAGGRVQMARLRQADGSVSVKRVAAKR